MKSRWQNYSLTNQRGVGLVETLMWISISLMVFYSLSWGTMYMTKQTTKTSTIAQLSVFKQNISTLVLSGPAWTNTIKQNSALGNTPAGGMDCLKPAAPTPCTTDGTPNGPPITNRPFAIFDAASNLPATPAYYDGTDAANGWSAHGSKCSTFTAGVPTDDCVFQYQLTWSAVCNPPTVSCVSPQIKIQAILSVNTKSPLISALNANNYSISGIYR